MSLPDKSVTDRCQCQYHTLIPECGTKSAMLASGLCNMIQCAPIFPLWTATAVPIDTSATSSSLPIDDVLPALLEALERSTRCLLVAQPGAGKTTRVPLALICGSE